jgi:putative transposase
MWVQVWREGAPAPERGVTVKQTKELRQQRQNAFMTHSHRAHFFHRIWSTKSRENWLDKEIQSRLYPYLRGIIRNQKGSLLEAGGMPDHIHLLLKLDNLDRYSEFLRDIKANSSRWIHKNFPALIEFAWQEGYGSYTVSYSALEKAREYIKNQERHHKNMTSEEEYRRLLNLHDVDYDERFI